MKLLTFLLSGPLQSWGDSARWDHRSTASMPSKSAVIGLLDCCLGYGRGDERLRALSERVHVAVRADRKGRPAWDFQTVQSPGGKMLNAMGKPRTGGGTIITPKQYLQDAAFQVFVFGDDAALEACHWAMRHPRWAACLGRRSCPPSRPMLPRMVEYPTVKAALEREFDPTLDSRDPVMECQVEAVPGLACEGQIVTRMDEVVRGDLNQYLARTVYTCTVRRG